MPTYNLVIREHEEYGEMGIAMKEAPEYFDPALRGDVLAHDILEHHPNAHPNGYVDEFMALGSVIAGRIEYGYTDRYTGRHFDFNDIESDVSGLIRDAVLTEQPFNIACNSYVQDEMLMKNIREAVRNGIIEGYDETDEALHMNVLNEIVQNITGWICKGIQRYNKRFRHNRFKIATDVFSDITTICNRFMAHNVEGQEAKLHVNFTTGRVYLEEIYDYE